VLTVNLITLANATSREPKGAPNAVASAVLGGQE
jgi:hypothetical protein